MKIYNIGKIPIKLWADDIEEEALLQAKNLSDLDFAFSHIALMPDVHMGFGMPIGGVLATKDVVIPNAVGVDIGCGVRALKTDILVEELERKKLNRIVEEAYKKIPLGFKKHKRGRDWEGFGAMPDSEVLESQLENARLQLGTLGSGNHFISMEAGSDGYIWLMVHSGSRNFGYQVANHYNDLAKSLEENKNSKDLAGLGLETQLGQDYFRDMNFVLDFAKENRSQLLEDFYGIFRRHTGSKEIVEEVECHHNYASYEEHFSEKLIVHRKGAINAEKGRLGIIPGSMGTSSFIVEGLGNEESFKSSSHGAGRDMSRKEANKTIAREDFRRSMKNIVFREGRDLSEAPSAYKDIHKVMENQKDLVRPRVELRPLGVIKG